MKQKYVTSLYRNFMILSAFLSANGHSIYCKMRKNRIYVCNLRTTGGVPRVLNGAKTHKSTTQNRVVNKSSASAVVTACRVAGGADGAGGCARKTNFIAATAAARRASAHSRRDRT
ncbi:hypothetical protein EVAR_78272_1 [Eumeta japonica]|uniref:Uncharacterized protein n=1 Tax=Eumeta variegata TaxID=151549 RepID=A0A4C1T5Y0_EUMVA|nr:hypothetical protein EVAR_78272_1 [Eumeta japonica]